MYKELFENIVVLLYLLLYHVVILTGVNFTVTLKNHVYQHQFHLEKINVNNRSTLYINI